MVQFATFVYNNLASSGFYLGKSWRIANFTNIEVNAWRGDLFPKIILN